MRSVTPWHLWFVGIIAVFWNAMGSFDFVMTMTQNDAYMANFSQEQLAVFYGFPSWVYISWGIATTGGLIGSLLLLLRSQLAVFSFFISFVAMIVTTVQNYIFGDMLSISGHFEITFSAIIFIVALLLYVYSRAMKRRGVLA